MPTAILASFVPALLALGTWLQPFLRRNGPKTGAREGDHERRRGVVEWSRSEPLQRTPLDTATGEGLPGLSCFSRAGVALSLTKLDIVTLFSNMGLVLSACASGITARTQEQSR